MPGSTTRIRLIEPADTAPIAAHRAGTLRPAWCSPTAGWLDDRPPAR